MGIVLRTKNKTRKRNKYAAGVILCWAKEESLSDIIPFGQKSEGSDGVSHAIMW